ncbi:MAG: vanadium-dependent haloperoxidase [Candidatus Dependentiae bacterium]
MRKKMPFQILSITLLCVYNIYGVERFSYDERPGAYETRMRCAYNENYNVPNYNIENENNGDQETVPDYAGNYTKAFPHDASTGIATDVGQQSYETLVKALKNGKQETYNTIVRTANDASKLVNPQCSAAWSLIGRDSSLVPLALPPKLDSRWAACEMAEVYLQAICRDVSFNDYGTGQGTDRDTDGQSITQKAANLLNAYGNDYKGAKPVTPANLFRGPDAGCLVGPYLSQFFWQDLHFLNQPLAIINPYIPTASKHEFGVTWDNFVSIQDGFVPVAYGPTDFDGQRYAINGRDAGTWVHNDLPVDSYNNALNVLINNGFPSAPNLPYFNGLMPNEDPFGTMGAPDTSQLIAAVSVQALKEAWAHKWRAARRLRPEAMAGLAHQAKVTGENPYGLNDALFATLGGVNVMDWTLARNITQNPLDPNNATYLLGLMYPEGSPTHPSYPAGHATVAGACTTVIKALVADQALFADYLTPVKPNPNDPTLLIALTNAEGANLITVGGELDKLASNIALARDFAGVHYRSDGDYGINLGELVAIYFLQDWAATYAEEKFDGFELTKRNGQRIRITANDIAVIS